MRHLVVPLFLCLLTICLLAAWSYRFAPADGAASVGMDALIGIGDAPSSFSRQGGMLAMGVVEGASREVSFAIPEAAGAGNLYVRVSAAAENLVRGPGLWDDGRIFLEWLDPETGASLGVSRIHSARGDDGSGPHQVVVDSPAKGSVPVLQLQNLGKSGSYVVREIEITPARERAVWWLGRWALLIGFAAALATLSAWGPGTKKPARWRGWVAAAIWLLVAVSYAFPGPWESARPFGVPFAFGEAPALDAAAQGAVDHQVTDLMDDDTPIIEEFPPSDDLGLRLRLLLPGLRPLMHVALLFAPVLAIAWLVGARGALTLGIMLSLSVEAAQVLYGFGFGWDDVGDLFFNSLGIAAALWVHRRFARRIHAFMPFPFPKPIVRER